MMHRFDVAIIGAGIAGASLGWALARRGLDVVLLEAEDQPGYHTTGRSAAFWVESYGGPEIVPLSRASRAFFAAPPEGFGPLLSLRQAVHLQAPDAPETLEELAAEFDAGGVAYEHVGVDWLARYAMLRPEWRQAGILEADCHDIDVAALHQGFLRGLTLLTGFRVSQAEREAGLWQLNGAVAAPVVVNAAGAWADGVGAVLGCAPKGLQPLRRTMAVLRLDPEPPADLPVMLDSALRFYFKPDAGRLWLSPHDETPDVPHDVRPDEMDLAVVIDRFERVSTSRVVRLERSWAGLRTFARDRKPVLGFDPGIEGVFWCAGQGGFGIQTAPAVADLCARVLTGEAADAGAYDAARAL
ncbi:MAG: NAD(P)/FAD-dependent oxidoreductase [Polymorphobacter sp.]|uniref:NAD(P)/FAD-dependent oxidoreductase n=1 Tax=Polymorphobacter sp. TaxID=1909290 RepID=UPI003A880421